MSNETLSSCLSTIKLEEIIVNDLANHNSSVLPHLTVCSYCAGQYSTLKQFYHQLNHELSRIETAAEQRLVASVISASPGPKNIMVALPWEGITNDLYIPQPLPDLVAATARSSVLRQYHYLGILVTDNENSIVSVMRDEVTTEITLHISSDNPEEFEYILLHIPPLEGIFISDNNGQVKLGTLPLPPISDISVIFQTAYANFCLNASMIKNLARGGLECINEKDCTIQIRFYNALYGHKAEVKIIQPLGTTKHCKISRGLLIHDGKLQLCTFKNDVGWFHINECLENFSIKLFY